MNDTADGNKHRCVNLFTRILLRKVKIRQVSVGHFDASESIGGRSLGSSLLREMKQRIKLQETYSMRRLLLHNLQSLQPRLLQQVLKIVFVGNQLAVPELFDIYTSKTCLQQLAIPESG